NLAGRRSVGHCPGPLFVPGALYLPVVGTPYGLALGLGVPNCGVFDPPTDGFPSGLAAPPFWYIPGPTTRLGRASGFKPTAAGGAPVVQDGLRRGTSFRMLRQPAAVDNIPRARTRQQPAIMRLGRSIDMDSSYVGARYPAASSRNCACEKA